MSFLTEVSGPPIAEAPSPHWIFDKIAEHAKHSPGSIAFAIDHQNSIQEYRYADVLVQADAIATLLQEKGAQYGDRVGILMENIPQWVFVLLGAMRIGAITVPLATTLPETSIRLIAEHAACTVIFADDANREKAAAVAKNLGIEVLDGRV